MKGNEAERDRVKRRDLESDDGEGGGTRAVGESERSSKSDRTTSELDRRTA